MVMRVGGLATGMDIDSLVKEMMNARRAPVNKLVQKKQIMEWQREDYRSINSKLLDFRNTKLFEFKKESTLTARQAEISGAEHTLSANTTGSSVNGPIRVEVLNTATATTKFSQLVVDAGEGPATKLSDLGLTGTKLTINSKDITFDPATDTLESLISKINNHPDAGVTAFYYQDPNDPTKIQMSMSSKSTGSASNFSLSSDGNAAATLFNWDTTKTQTGADATVRINGIETKQKSNTFTVNGTEITVKAPSTSYLEGGVTKYNPTIVNVTTDTDGIIDSIKDFIADYNGTLTSLYEKVNENRYRDFQPLTAEQKESMKDKEVEMWETKAKSGHLKNDAILSRAMYAMREAVITPVETGSLKYKTLSAIGIETGSYDENGILHLKDEEKLRKALQEDPNAVKALFTADGDTSGDTSGDTKMVGIAERLYTISYTAISDIADKAGTSKFSTSETFKFIEDSSMGKQLKSMSREIDSWNDRLKDIEDRYYRQFTAMETAINKYNNQSAYLMNALNGGQ